MMRNTALWSCVVEALLFAAYGISVMSYGRDEGSALFTLEEPVDDACVLVSSLLIMFTALGVVGEGATIERGECFYTFYGWCSLVGLVALLYPLYAISYAINQWSGTATYAAALVLVLPVLLLELAAFGLRYWAVRMGCRVILFVKLPRCCASLQGGASSHGVAVDDEEAWGGGAAEWGGDEAMTTPTEESGSSPGVQLELTSAPSSGALTIEHGEAMLRIAIAEEAADGGGTGDG